jgi:D-alanyl-D-alanine carboxypeptidase
MTLAGLVIGYFVYENFLLKENKTVLESEISRTKDDFNAAAMKLNGDIKNLEDDIKKLNDILDKTKNELATTTAERDSYRSKYAREKKKMDDFGKQIDAIEGKVGTLQKLSETDPELLKKYSKIFFLNENYIPQSFVKIDKNYTFDPKEDCLFDAQIWPFLEDLLMAAEDDEIDLKITSAYRSFGSQANLKSIYKMIYGTGANKFSADQGYSEHQLGTTVDFTTLENNSAFSGFEKTAAYEWLQSHAYKYGFILSYPQGNAYYQYEPWHWRFVGRKLAKSLHKDGENFYDLDQREIDEYLISFYD